MKQSIFYFAFLMMALFGSQKGMPVENDFAIFFESINYKGAFYLAHLNSDECIELPKDWQNRASSLIVRHCIVVYTTPDCKSNNESHKFANLKEKYFDVTYSSKLNDIFNLSFYGSSIRDKVKSYRACPDMETSMASILIRKFKFRIG